MSFTFKTTPYKHQFSIFEKVKDLPYVGLWLEMGTGKTKLTIDLIRYVFFKKHTTNEELPKVLIVCPKIMLNKWKEELLIHSNIKSIGIIKGEAKTKLKIVDINYQIYIINFEALANLYKQLAKKKFNIVVVDESQRIKNPSAICTKLVIELSNKAEYRYALSGTPILQGGRDIFSQALFLDRGERFGISFLTFNYAWFYDANLINKYWIEKNERKYIPIYKLKEAKEKEFKEKVQSLGIVLTKEECLDLPEKVYLKYSLDMPKEISKHYKEMTKDLITYINEHKNEATVASTAATKIIRLMQISAGILKIDSSSEVALIKPNPKIEALKDILESIKLSKIIIWSWFTHSILELKEELKQYNPAVIYGSVTNKEREEELKKFKEKSDCKIIIVNQAVARVGIDLVEANYAIYYTQNFNLEYRAQSEDRCHRIGSERHSKITYIDLIYKNSIDEVVLAALREKKNLANNILGIVNLLEKGGE